MNTLCTKFVVILVAMFGFNLSLRAQCATNTAAGTSCNRSNVYHGEILPNQGCDAYTVVNNYGPGRYFRMPVLLGGCYTVQTCGAPIDTQLSAFQGTAATGPFSFNDDNGPECAGNQASINFVPNFTDYTRVDVRQYNCQPGGSSSITVRVRQNNNLNITSPATDMCEGETRTLTATPVRVISGIVGAGDLGTFSGIGVSGTTFTAPTPVGSSQTFTITYTFGYCTVTQDITVIANGQAGCNVLGVTYGYIDAYQSGKNNMVMWSTLSEENSDYFIVEKSTDGENWEFIEEIQAAGNSSQEIQYSSLDKKPSRGGTDYYRLKQVDIDGSVHVSKIVFVKNTASIDFELLPNPAENDVKISSDSKFNLVQLYDISGKVILEQELPLVKTTVIELVDYKTGVYFVRVSDPNGKTQLKKLMIK